jgi:hypothetical protein
LQNPRNGQGFILPPRDIIRFPQYPRLKGDGLMRIPVCDKWHRVFGHSVPYRDPDQVGSMKISGNFERSMRTDTGYRDGQLNPKSTG